MPIPFLAPLIAAATSAGGAGIIQSFINARSARRNTDLANRANRELADQAYSRDLEMMNKSNQYNREMWDLGNQYNSPQGQMQRLQSAGLNPSLVYSGGSAGGNSSAPIPRSEIAKYNAPTAQYKYIPSVDLPAMISMYQDFSVKQAQVDNLKSQTENTRARTANESIQSGLLRLKGESGRESLEQMKKLFPYQAEIVGAQAYGEPIKNALLFNQMKGAQFSAERQRRELGNMDQLRAKLDADVLFAQYRNQWLQMGITSSDNIAFRFLARMLGELGVNPSQLLDRKK